MVKIGVIADTHIPDRKKELDPQVAPTFQNAGVDLILHAGDISIPRVLDQLQGIAPVYAVRGNRDWLRLPELPKTQTFLFDGVHLGLVHGHGNLWFYLWEKVRFHTVGYSLDFYRPFLLRTFPGSDVIVFGHSHVPVVHQIGRVLLFNPGSPCCPPDDYPSSVGLLTIHQGKIEGKIIPVSV